MIFRLLLFTLLSELPTFKAQHALGLGASIHRYDQVLSLDYSRKIRMGNFCFSGGVGVERTLQGAIAPQLGLSWQSSFLLQQQRVVIPFYTIAYQVDFQKSKFIDVFQGVYTGLGLSFGEIKHLKVLLMAGLVKESLLQTENQLTPLFFNPQLRVQYLIPMNKS